MWSKSLFSILNLKSRFFLWVACLLPILAMILLLGNFHSAQAAIEVPPPTLIAASPSEAYNSSPSNITITGTGFFTDAGISPQVTLDNVLLSNITFVSSTTLTATVPAGFPSGAYTLTVKNPDGQSANLPAAFRVLQASDGSLTAWNMLSPMNTNRFALAAVAVNGYIYALGGQSKGGGNALTNVEAASINADGSLDPWQTVSAMNTPRGNLAAVATDNYMYAIGGSISYFNTEALASVERAVINPDGSLGSWQYVSTMTMPRVASAAVAVGGYLYVIGGAWDTNSVERAAINDDGSLGAWQQVSSMTTPHCCLGAVAVGRYIYAIGGQGGGSASLRSVERATIGSDGSLGTWEEVNPMISARCDLAAVAVDSYIYAIGGGSCHGETYNSVERAKVNLDGSINPWEAMPAMITPRMWLAAAQDSHNIYALGGWDEGSTILNSIEQITVGIPSIISFTPLAVRSDQATGVMVNGINILPSPSLLVDETNMDVSFVSTTTLTATIPTGLANGWHPATLTSGDGRTARLEHALRVDGPGPVAIGEYGLTINEGALFTNNISVVLTISSRSDTELMQVSNDGGFTGAQWETYTSHKTWQITQYGNYIIPRVVYVRYKDILGNTSATYQDDILLDLTPPVGDFQIIRGILSSNDSCETFGIPQPTGSLTQTHTIFLPMLQKSAYIPVRLLMSATDDISGVYQMMISIDANFTGGQWQPYRTEQEWMVNATRATTFYVKFRDYAGNVSEVVSHTFYP